MGRERIEYGGAWVHWHQPHTFSELTRAGLTVSVSPEAGGRRGMWATSARAGRSPSATRSSARVGPVRRRGGEALPQPHAPLGALGALGRFDRLSIAERIDELALDEEERDVLAAELESLAHGPLDQAGAVSVLRWHALSGYSLALTQFTGGRVTIDAGTGALLAAIRDAAPFDVELESPVAASRRSRREWR